MSGGRSRNAKPRTTRHDDREGEDPEDRLGLADELEHAAPWSARASGAAALTHRAAPGPVSEMKTSSSVARCVERDTRRAPASSSAREQRGHRLGQRGGARASQPPSRWRRSPTPGIAARIASATAGSRRELDDVRRVQARDQLGRRALRDDPAVVHDRDAVAETLGLLHVVRRQQDGAPGGLEARDVLPELQAALRVEARRRLVEEEHLRIARQRAGDREPLALAAGELADARVALLLEREVARGAARGRGRARRRSGRARASRRP